MQYAVKSHTSSLNQCRNYSADFPWKHKKVYLVDSDIRSDAFIQAHSHFVGLMFTLFECLGIFTFSCLVCQKVFAIYFFVSPKPRFFTTIASTDKHAIKNQYHSAKYWQNTNVVLHWNQRQLSLKLNVLFKYFSMKRNLLTEAFLFNLSHIEN